jgi:hypothetical protein
MTDPRSRSPVGVLIVAGLVLAAVVGGAILLINAVVIR